MVREFFDRRDGLAERILWAYPAALPPRGERFYEVPFELSAQWSLVLRNLWSMTMKPAGPNKKRPRAHVLPLSDAGREAWRGYTDRLAATMSDPDFPPWMKSAYGKFEGSAARLALVLQLLALAGSNDSDPPACIEAQWVGSCFGCRSPGPTQSIDGPPAHEVGGTLPPPKPKAPADIAEVATEGKAQPAATDRQPAEGERKSNAEKGRDNRESLVNAIKAAGKSLTTSEAAQASGMNYNAAYKVLTGHPDFQKSPSGKWELNPAR